MSSPRVDLMQRLEVHTVLLQCPWHVILDQDIGIGCKLMQHLDTSGVRERESNGLLVPVHLYHNQDDAQGAGARRSLRPGSRRSLQDLSGVSAQCWQTEGPMLGCHHLRTPVRYVGKGGPLPRASSPRVGCSTLITSALCEWCQFTIA